MDNFNELRTLSQIKADLHDYNNQIEKFSNHFKNIKFEIETIQKNIKETDKYIDKDIPIIIQGQISSTLHSCLGRRERKILNDYEDKKFNKLEEKYESNKEINRNA